MVGNVCTYMPSPLPSPRFTTFSLPASPSATLRGEYRFRTSSIFDVLPFVIFATGLPDDPELAPDGGAGTMFNPGGAGTMFFDPNVTLSLAATGSGSGSGSGGGSSRILPDAVAGGFAPADGPPAGGVG